MNSTTNTQSSHRDNQVQLETYQASHLLILYTINGTTMNSTTNTQSSHRDNLVQFEAYQVSHLL